MLDLLIGLGSDIGADESGTTSIEYALIGTLVAVACVVSFAQLGTALGGLYTLSQSLFAAAVGP